VNNPGGLWQQAADNFERHLSSIADDQWDDGTTCDGWTIRDLVEHTLQWQRRALSLLGDDIDPGAGWDDIRSAAVAALADPSCLEGSVDTGPGQSMEKHQVFGFALGDLLIHSWDLARSLEADQTLPAEVVEAVQLGLDRVPEEMMRAPNMFGPAVEVPADAGAQDRLLAYAGRQP
jgi:uncharacterized protein (TIGR03086 family)